MNKAFSLLELSIVMVVIAVTLTAGLDLVNDKTSKLEQTKDRIQEVRDAIALYRQRNSGKMPCPAPLNVSTSDSTFGVALSEVNCKLTAVGTGTYRNSTYGVRVGGVPINTLGLANKYAFDTYGNKLTYVVTEDAVDGTDTDLGKIPIFDANDNIISSPIFLILSHGADGRGAFNINGTVATGCVDGVAARHDAANCVHTTAGDVDNVALAFVNTNFNDGDIAARRFDDVMSFGFSDLDIPECEADEKLQWNDSTGVWNCIEILEGCLADRVLYYNGSSWQCQDAGSLTNAGLPACTDGQTISYNSSASTWECAALSGGGGGGGDCNDVSYNSNLFDVEDGSTNTYGCYTADSCSTGDAYNSGDVEISCASGNASVSDTCQCGCTFDGSTYSHGASFNRACTNADCGGDPVSSGYHYYSCNDGTVTNTSSTCSCPSLP